MKFLKTKIVSFIILSFLFVLSGNLKAQSLDFGIIGGLNFSSHLNSFRFADRDISLDLEPQMSFSYQAGLILRKNISPTFRLHLEPTFIQLGATYNELFTLRGFELQTESQTRLSYIQLPLLVQLTTRTPQEVVYGRPQISTTYHMTGGVFGGYLLDARFTGTNTGAPIGVSYRGDFSNDVMSQYSTYDGGVILGLGLEHGQSKRVGLETRAQYSVLGSGDAPNLQFEPQNIAVMLSVYLIL